MARLFFALEVICPWPEILPKGRYLNEKERHQTLAFLGEKDPDSILEELKACDLSPLIIGPAGFFDTCLFLPKKHPRTACWHAVWLTLKEPLFAIQKVLTNHFVPDETRDFLPHVTLARQPFDKSSWEKAFTPLPVYGSAIHLYESLGNLTYVPLYTIPLVAPFEEQEHTADMAFCIRAKNINELFYNAAIALSFTFPPFLDFFAKDAEYKNLDEVIGGLNMMIAHADSLIGCPVKAVSFHGEAKVGKDNLLEWEMIVDV